MVRSAFLVSALILAAGCASAAAQTPPTSPPVAPSALPPHPPVEVFEVVNVFPHDPEAFTQGLIYVDGRMFESTGRYPSTVREVRLEDGEILARTTLDLSLFGEGLTEIEGRLYSLTWQGGQGFIWDRDDLTDPIGTFRYEGEGWGLTDNDDQLILSDGTPVIRFLDPETFEVTRQVTVTFRGQPVSRLNELEWVNGQILANIWLQDLIVRIDPETGDVVGVIDLTDVFPAAQRARPRDDVLNGIAWDEDGQRLFVTGKDWPHLFEIRLVPAEPAAP
ncbi:glutaminyl-peptide cyclotransferase [Brevundimonas aveniformis]|uniref:glutaminyl-peptide cyclotransferase n=1 Tax=Brevundimonas aveniformis TaxID=370977 RepID=UPI0003F74592|nr:glutaminyl-peptide cyclotransferase [Brevundimonas aveniformis]